MGKKICIIVQHFYEIDPRVQREAQALLEGGHTVHVIALRSEMNSRSHSCQDGVIVYTIPISKKRSGKLNYLWEYFGFLLISFFLLSRLMLRYQYDIVQVCNIPDFLIFSAIVPKLLGSKLILDMHEIMPELFMSKYQIHEEHPVIRVLKFLERMSIRFADHVVVVTDPIQKILEGRSMPCGKSTVILNTADEKLFDVYSYPSNGHGNGGQFRIVFHGTLGYRFGLDIALQAFASIINQMENAVFWILGSGDEKENLVHLSQKLGLNNKVMFCGLIPHREIPKWLAQCDLAVVPLRKDWFMDLAFSSKVPECILMRKPVVMSRTETMQYYFSEKSLAYFEPNNQEDLAQKMLDLYRDAAWRARLVEQAEIEYSKINWSIMKKRYLDLVAGISISGT